jgi:hydroxymethylglutaryl-CoA reductase
MLNINNNNRNTLLRWTDLIIINNAKTVSFFALYYTILRMNNAVSDFPKLSREKLTGLPGIYSYGNHRITENLLNSDLKSKITIDSSTITNFYIPSWHLNFLINGKYSTIPMAIEESSVVAAASKSAKILVHTRAALRRHC